MKTSLILAAFLTVSSPTPVLADAASGAFSGVMIGEILCSLRRYGAPKDFIFQELERVTGNLLDAGLLEDGDQSIFKEAFDRTVKSCPKLQRSYAGTKYKLYAS